MRVPLRTNSAPTSLGSINLVAAQGVEVDAQRAHVDRNFPSACTPSECR